MGGCRKWMRRRTTCLISRGKVTRLTWLWAAANEAYNAQPYFLFRFVKANRTFLPLSLSFLFTFSMKVFRSVSGLLLLSLMAISFLNWQFMVNCITYLSTKPATGLWYYLVIYLTLFVPLSFKGKGEGYKKRGFAPLRHPLTNALHSAVPYCTKMMERKINGRLNGCTILMKQKKPES